MNMLWLLAVTFALIARQGTCSDDENCGTVINQYFGKDYHTSCADDSSKIATKGIPGDRGPQGPIGPPGKKGSKVKY